MEWLSKTLIVCPVYYGLCISETDFLKELKRMGVKERPDFLAGEFSNACVHFFTSPSGVSAIVCIDPTYKGFSKLEMEMVLVHEAVHIWQEIKTYLGEESPSKEFEAYSIQSLAQNLITSFRTQIKNARR